MRCCTDRTYNEKLMVIWVFLARSGDVVAYGNNNFDG
jgi:hypothetical protein